MTKRHFYKKRPIVGPVEEVVISNGDKKRHRVLARIDTGADFSTICEKLASSVGFERIVRKLNKVEKIIKSPTKYFKKEKELLKKIKGVTGVVLVRQASGLTRRVFVPLKIKLANRIIKTQVTIIKRTHMSYPMIIGRKDLQKEGFMVDPKRRR
ncbi:MAG: Alpha-L-glutamate ligase-like protein [Candidatus Berkelbacteria bacterium Licking1014_96]|uniref:Alpha-L-glutamate ligase-like protein n=1 Tax=Candidatus Berkelbacteria bacterium Licking1014_96 TaxID=2017149 RepID=A0A554LGY6_9BACT|nr:MAG: Alpha-L-glutamate ligase-like protein [Candidatus Berkelbacteria bacterium Licking1014_96]